MKRAAGVELTLEFGSISVGRRSGHTDKVVESILCIDIDVNISHCNGAPTLGAYQTHTLYISVVRL